MRFYRVLPLLISFSVAAAAEVRLSPEERIAPLATHQRNVQAVRRSGHVLSAWVERDRITSASNVMDVALDGVVLPDPHVISPKQVGGPVIAAGSHTFLVAWTQNEGSSFLARAIRISLDGVNLDGAPIELCRGPQSMPGVLSDGRGPQSTPGLLFDGNAYIVTCTERVSPDRTRIIRITEDGSVLDQVPPPRIVQPDVRPLLGNGQLVFAGASYVETIIMTIHSYINVYGLNDPAAETVSTSGPVWSAAAGPDRIVIAMFNYHVSLAETSFTGKLTRDLHYLLPHDVENISKGAIVWNGGEYVLVWAGDRLRGIRLDRNGNPIDAVPFDISGPGAGEPSLSVTDNGVLIAYGYPYGGWPAFEVHAYMRTLERLPSPPRRTSVRH